MVVFGELAGLPGLQAAGAMDFGNEAGRAEKRREENDALDRNGSFGKEQRAEASQRNSGKPDPPVTSGGGSKKSRKVEAGRPLEIKIEIGLGN